MRFGEEWTENWNGVRSTPLVHQGKVYIMSSFGKLVCMGAERGNIIWTVDLFATYGGQQIEWGVTENLLIDDEKLFVTVGGTRHNIIALNKDTGKQIWTSSGNSEKSAYGSPLLISFPGRKLLVTMTEQSLLGLDVATGKKLWRQELVNTYGVHPNTPIYSNGNLFITTGYGTGGYMLKLSAEGSIATKTWSNATLDPKTGGIVLLNGVIYGFSDKNRGFHGVDWASGKTVFSDKFNQKGGSVIAADGMLFAYDESGEVALLQPTSGGFKKQDPSKSHSAQLNIGHIL
ncbi:MAG: PQQ-like beta-propeller repeat protein [Bacteroidales bacterium]|nr:PQQ-like beta-propeller repeat protein [Bacteroidales bacterium]